MRRFLILLLCLTLLTGCTKQPQTPSFRETEPRPTTEPLASTEATCPTEKPNRSLLDQGEAYGESGNLMYIANPHVESMACPEICIFGNDLLLYEHAFDGTLQIKRISLEDGSLLAEASYTVDPSVRVQVGNGFIGLCDSGSGKVLILDELLELEMTYAVPLEGENWYLNQELETLFAYTDRVDQRNYRRCLNLSTATLESLPLDGFVSSGGRSGEQWLLRQDVDSGAYILVNQEKTVTFTQSEGLVELLPDRRQLLITDGSYRALSLYDLDGNFLSQCQLPVNEYASVGTNLVWSSYWQGYFFRDTYDNAAHLLFWDIAKTQEGENLSVTPLGSPQNPDPMVDQELYQRAQALSQRFGIDIRIAEQCKLDYTHYQADVLADPDSIRYTLNVLELAFSSYPEGFFRQLIYGDVLQIRIELVGDIREQDHMDTHPESARGFAQIASDHYLIVFDGRSLSMHTVYHELSHVIDKRLEWDATLRPQALFSEEVWLSLQPDGFRYANSYIDMPDEIAAYENSGYFISRYAMTFPTEDRATLMSVIMSDKTVLQENPGMAEKMRYYAACIRDCFNTEGWPETTLWEYVPQS